MKIRHVTTLVTLFLVAGSSCAQIGSRVHRDKPASKHPPEIIQGGALKEYRVAPPPGRLSSPVNPGSQSSGSSSSSSPGTTQTYRSPEPQLNMRPPPVAAPELMVHSRNGVSWLCGGIGEQEVNFMKNEARHYDLMLTFAARNGDYLANVDVTLQGPGGNTLMETQCDGPIMLVNVRGSGAYRIRAEFEMHEVTRMVQVRDGQGQHRIVVMTWPMTSASMYSGPISSGGSGEPEVEGEDYPATD